MTTMHAVATTGVATTGGDHESVAHTPARSAALSDLARVVPGIAVFAVTIGVAATAVPDVGPVATIGGGWAISAGSAQLAATTILGGGGGVAAAVLAGVLANARMMFYGAALEPHFRAQGRWFRLLTAHFIVDPTYAAVTGRPIPGPAYFRSYWLWLGSLLGTVWTLGLAVGVTLGPALPAIEHVGLVAAGLFLPMLLPRLKARPAVVSATVAASTTAVLAAFSPSMALLAASVAGMAAGVLSARSK